MNGPTDRYQPYLNFVETNPNVFEHQGPSTRAMFKNIHTPYSV